MVVSPDGAENGAGLEESLVGLLQDGWLVRQGVLEFAVALDRLPQHVVLSVSLRFIKCFVFFRFLDSRIFHFLSTKTL